MTMKKPENAPAWAVPALVVLAVVAVVVVGKRHEKVIENPLVDLIIITVGVFAFAAVFRVIGYKLNNPGFAAFFGAESATSDRSV